MSRADFSCEKCHSATKTLNVHHKEYRKGAKPWEYADHELECLCEDCHGEGHGKTKHAPRVFGDSPAERLDELLHLAESRGISRDQKSELSNLLRSSPRR
jgi:hypothetical protein